MIVHCQDALALHCACTDTCCANLSTVDGVIMKFFNNYSIKIYSPHSKANFRRRDALFPSANDALQALYINNCLNEHKLITDTKDISNSGLLTWPPLILRDSHLASGGVTIH